MAGGTSIEGRFQHLNASVPLARGEPQFRFSEAAGFASLAADQSIDAGGTNGNRRRNGPDAGAALRSGFK